MSGATKTDLWRTTVGKRPHTLSAEERPDRGYEVQLRWSEPHPEKPGKYANRYCLTGLTVRDERGRRRREREKIAAEAAERAQALLAAGDDPRDWNKGLLSAGGAPRTLAQGFTEALPDRENEQHIGTLYAVRDRTSLDVRTGADYVEQHLGSDTAWESLRPTHIVSMWRAMARAYKAGTGPGYRSVVRALSALYVTWGHLREAHGEDFPAPQRPEKMRRRLREDWERITGENLKEKRKDRKKTLRYSQEEMAKLFSRIAETREAEICVGGRKNRRKIVTRTEHLCDPRVRMVVEIGAELRPGQVVRAMRSHLSLDRVGRYGLGRFAGDRLGRGHKLGQTVDLHPELRAYIDEVLTTGHLAELEAAYQRGDLTDYPLYPAGKLVRGRVPLERVLKHPGAHLHVTRAIVLWNAYETAAGVDHVDGRSFYGLRRGLTDVAMDRTKDPRVLNSLTGHADSATREEYYLDQEREADIGGAAEIRRQVRLELSGRAAAEEPDPSAELLAALEQLGPEAKQRLLDTLLNGSVPGSGATEGNPKSGGLSTGLATNPSDPGRESGQ